VGTCTLINAYVLNNDMPSGGFGGFYLQIVNNWLNNQGDLLPSFLLASGSITNPSVTYDSVALFFDDGVLLQSLDDMDEEAGS
jgi:hypothetical protein